MIPDFRVEITRRLWYRIQAAIGHSLHASVSTRPSTIYRLNSIESGIDLERISIPLAGTFGNETVLRRFSDSVTGIWCALPMIPSISLSILL